MRFLLHDRSEPPLILVTHYRSGLRVSCPTMPSADSCPPVSAPYGTLSSGYRTTDRPPGVSSAAFTTHLSDLPPRFLMVMAFAILCLLRQPGRPRIGFLFVRSWICFTLPSDPASRRRPCASLVLRYHQAGQGTFTPELLNMPGTQRKPLRRGAGMRNVPSSAWCRVPPGESGISIRTRNIAQIKLKDDCDLLICPSAQGDSPCRHFLSKITACQATPNYIKCGVCGIYAHNSQELS